jgi:hypothetical protein
MSKIVLDATPQLLDGHMLAACRAGRMRVVQDLVATGFALDRVINHAGFSGTPLQAAVVNGRLDLCVMLLDAGADVAAANVTGETALRVACRTGNALMCDLLVGAGARVQERDREGETLRFEAGRSHKRKVLEWLLIHEADPNVASADGVVPLHLVAALRADQEFDEEVAELLVSAGAISCYVPAQADAQYRTPFQIAVATGNLPAVRYFVERCDENLWQRSHSGATLFQLAQRHAPVLKYLKAAEAGSVRRPTRGPVQAAVLSKRRSFEWPSRS